jgi:anti-sigma28 factor (negative regulator of flagellin synthesis)
MKNREHQVTLLSGDDSAIDRRDPLPAERVEQIRRRIRSGAYDTSAVIDAVARGITKNGDLRESQRK